MTQVWQGYAARIFLSFGKLTPSDRVFRSGRRGRPHGAIELTNMMSESSWVLARNGHVLATSESCGRRREKALQRLLGQRLLLLHIDPRSRATVVRFSRGDALTTADMAGSRERGPHWVLRRSEHDWPPVALTGTAYRWREENRRLRMSRR